MTYLLDTNSLIYYYRNEPGAQIVQQILDGDQPAFVTNLTIVELRATLAKFVRDDSISFGPKQYALINRRFSADVSSIGPLRIQPIRRRFVDHATQLIEEYGLRRRLSLFSLDTLHFSAAVDLLARHDDLIWVTADMSLRNVAESHGIHVIDPISSMNGTQA